MTASWTSSAASDGRQASGSSSASEVPAPAALVSIPAQRGARSELHAHKRQASAMECDTRSRFLHMALCQRTLAKHLRRVKERAGNSDTWDDKRRVRAELAAAVAIGAVLSAAGCSSS